ncbi:MAG TPA: hypothetical protein VFE37_00805 [Chloroflexota bacterium]|nr:hypothetical protein [Chloroflexota bacterium]
MRDEYWPLAEGVARDLAGRRVDPSELAQAADYLSTHRDAADFFALLDDLAGPAGAVLARSGQTAHHQAAVRDACQRLRDVPEAELPEVVGWAVRLLRYEQSQLPPPRPVAPSRPAAPARPAPRPVGPPVGPAAGAPAAARPPAPPPGPGRPGAPAMPGPRQRPAAAAERGPGAPAHPPRPGQPAPAERGAARPAAQQPPPPPPPRRPPTMDDMLRQLQAQFGGGHGPEPSRPAPSRQDPAEVRRERARREQEAIRERYRQQREQAEEE